MIVEEASDGTVTGIHVTSVPAIVLVFEAEAKPRAFTPPDLDDLRRVLVGLSDEWRELLERALEPKP